MPATVTTSPDVPTLWHVQYFCSSIPYNIALELNIPKTSLAIKKITDKDLRKGSDILAVSPRRVVPVLQFPDGSVISEVGAITLHLLENFDKDGELHPLPGNPLRPKFLQGVVYVVAECYRAAMDLFVLCIANEEEHRLLGKEDRDREKVEAAVKRFEEIVMKHLERELTDEGYYLGEEVTAPDLMFAYLLMCVEYIDEGVIERNDKVKEWFGKMGQREAYRKLFINCEV